MKFKVIVACVLAVATLGQGAAWADEYLCSVRNEPNRTGNWIPLASIVAFDAAANSASWTIGGNQQNVTLSGRISETNATRTTLVFNANEFRDEDRQYLHNMEYRLTIRHDTNEFRVTAVPLGYRNRFRGQGSCQPV